MNFIEDKELNLNETGNDLLNGKSYSETLKQIIQNSPNKGTFTIGLFGEWGSGKSSIIKTVKDEFSNCKEYDEIKFITYDAWKYVNDSFRRTFILKLQEELGYKENVEDTKSSFYCSTTRDSDYEIKFLKKHFNFFVGFEFVILILSALLLYFNVSEKYSILYAYTYIVSSFGIFVKILFSCFQKSFKEFKTTTTKPLLFAPEQFQSCFDEIVSRYMKQNIISKIKNKERKLIIIIDNIDRCTEDAVYTLLSDVKTFMNSHDNVLFIIPVDDKALKRHLTKNNSIMSNRDAEEFLRKFFNVEIRIKPLENIELYDFAKRLNEQYNLKLTSDTINIVANEYATNPRRIIQLFNNLLSELKVLSQNREDIILTKYQSVICKLLIIREEWDEYYKLIKENNELLKKKEYKNNEDKYSDLNRFLGKTYCLTNDTPINIIEKIISNSVSFQKLPNDIINSIISFNVSDIENFVITCKENNELIIKYLLDRLQKGIDRKHYKSEVPQMLVSLWAINKNVKLTPTHNKIIETFISGKCKEFIYNIPTEYYCYLTQYINDLEDENYLYNEIVNFLECELGENIKEDSLPFKLYKSVMSECNNIICLKNKFKIWYEQSSISLSALKLQDKIKYLVTDELIEYELNQFTNFDENSFVLNDLEFLTRYGQLSDIQNQYIFSKFNEKTPIPTNSNKKNLLRAIDYVTTILRFIKINNNNVYGDFYKKIFTPYQIAYQNFKNIIQTTTDELELKKIIDFIITIYISSNGAFEIKENIKLLFCEHKEMQSYIIKSIKKICDLNISVVSLQYPIIETLEINQETLCLLENIILEIDDEGVYYIKQNIVKIKLSYLLDNIKDEKYNKLINDFFTKIISNARIKEILVNLISVAEKNTIIALSPKVQKYAFDTVCKNIDDYENEKDLLEAIAISKNKDYIKCLIQLIIKKLAANNQDEFWKTLYEKVDSSLVSKKDKDIITALLAKEIIEE